MPKTLWEAPPSQVQLWAVSFESYEYGVNMSHFIQAGRFPEATSKVLMCEETVQDRGSWKERELGHGTGVIKENKRGGPSSHRQIW